MTEKAEGKKKGAPKTSELQKQMREQSEGFDNRLVAVEGSIEEIGEQVESLTKVVDEKFDQILSTIHFSDGKYRDEVHAGEQDLGEDHTANMIETPDGPAIEQPTLQSVDSPEFKEKAEQLQFMEEKVTIRVDEDNNENAMPIFNVWVNGQKKTFIPGNEYTVARKFVEGLARCKPVHYRNEEYTKPDGTFGVRWPARRGLRFPFSMVHDPNPRGADWLRKVLREPN